MPESPKHAKTLVVGRPNVLDEQGFLEDVKTILRSKLLTNGGPFVSQLEQGAREYLGVKHVVAVSNATVGLELALRARRFAPGAEVLLPSFTFVATARRRLRRADAGLLRRRRGDFMSIASAERATTPKPSPSSASIWGRGDAAALEAFAARRSSTSSTTAPTPSGGLRRRRQGRHAGRAEVFSLHATKLLNGFEGGLIATNDDALAVAATRARNFGFSGQDTIVSMGTNAKLSEVHAALALRHLRVVDATLDAYRAVAAAYGDALGAAGLLDGPLTYWNAPFLGADSGCTHSYVCVRVEPAFGVSRDVVMAELRKAGVSKRYFFPGVHAHAPYAHLAARARLSRRDGRAERVAPRAPGGRGRRRDGVARVVAELTAIHGAGASSPTRASRRRTGTSRPTTPRSRPSRASARRSAKLADLDRRRPARATPALNLQLVANVEGGGRDKP
ncbi:DegT/DnrJ/EryC1/StrS aminotransferase-like protein [Aureococcus anophagefferens]|nr:DegT/DnrJ/EryC1/StrS aminotransferase-like protein [Aureococcus anophagefferens]